ncbi:MAG: DNA repair protein RecO [Maricaulaceae bacterium]
MDWRGEGYILSVKKHGETSVIVDLLTRDRGRYAGLVRGGVGRKLRPILQPGNKIQAEWRARLSEHLGSYNVEPLSARAAEIMDDRLALSGLNAAVSITRETLPEREAYAAVYDAFEVLLHNLTEPDIWPALFVQWEAGLLSAMGYGLDLSACAATGATKNLTHVSPRSGRAVSQEAAEPYLDKLYALPEFMRGGLSASPQDIANGLALTGYFLETRVQWGVNRTLPAAREQMIIRLQEEGYVAPRMTR